MISELNKGKSEGSVLLSLNIEFSCVNGSEVTTSYSTQAHTLSTTITVSIWTYLGFYL